MTEVNKLNDILDYIDIGITDNNNKSHYILYISMIHDFFLNWDGVDFGTRYNIIKQCNLMITKLINLENGELKGDWIKMRSLIIPGLIEKDEELCDDDRYFSYKIISKNKDEEKYKHKLPILNE